MNTASPAEAAQRNEIERLRARVAELERERLVPMEIIENSPLMIAIVRAPDFVYEFVNPAFRTLAPGKEFLGRRFADVWADMSEPPIEILRNVIATGRSCKIEDAARTIQRRPGAPPEAVYLTCTWIPLPGTDGKPDRVLALAYDTTASVRQRQQLAESNQSLRENQTILRNFFDSSGVMRGIVEVRNGRIIHVSCNAAAAKMYGEDQDSIAGKSATEAGASQAVAQTWAGLYEDSRRTGKPVSMEYARRDADGQERWLLATASYLGEGSSGSPRFAYTILDLTDRKRAEEALRESEAHYRTLSETMLQGVVYQDAEGKIISMNPAAETILGKTLAEYLGNTSVDVEHDSIREDGSLFPGLEHPSMVALATGREVRAVRMGVYNPREKQYRWIQIDAVPLFRAGEPKPYQVYTIFEDITGRKLAEEVLHRQRQWLEVTLKSIGDAVLATDAGGRITFLNPVAAKLTGWTEAQALGRQAAEVLRTINEQTREPAEDIVGRVLREGCVISMANHTALVTRDGREIPVEDSAAPIRDSARNVLGVVLVFHDVTEKRRAHQELQNVINSISDGLQVLDRDWRYTYFSEPGARMIGMRREDLIGGCVWDLFPHAKGTKFYEEYHRAVETGQPVTFEEYYPEPLNKWLECHCYPSEAGLSVYFHDITGRRRAEQALRESEYRLRTLSDNLPEGAIYRYRIDTHGEPHVDFISAGIERLTGVPAAEFMADAATVERNVLPEDRDRLKAAIALSYERLTQFEVELRHTHRATGETRWSLLRSTPTRNPDGSTVWDGIELDITERRRVREELRENQAKLAEQEVLRLNQDLEHRLRERTIQVERAAAERVADELRRVNANLEHAVAERTAELQAILDAAPIPIWIAHDPECRRVTGNAYGDRVVMQMPSGGNSSLSAPPGEADVSFRAFRHGRELRPGELPLQTSLASGKVVPQQDLDLVFPDGRTVNMLLCAAPLLDSGGQVRGAVTAGLDVTELRKAEKALRDSEERLTLALQASQEGVWDWNLETNAAWRSARWREMLGYEESEIEPDIGFWERLLHPDDKARAIAMVVAVRRGRSELALECRCRHKDGHYVDILSRGVGLRREPGGPIVRIVGTNFDLTERKRAEEALRQSVQRERLLAGILEASEQPFAIGYPDGRLGICNRAYCELTGYSLEELQGVSWATRLTPAEWTEKETAALAELERTGKPVRYEKEYVTKDGRRVPVELLVHAARDESGKAEFYYSFLTDITERRRIHESLRRSRDELELRVQERTKELSSANEVLLAQIEERERAQAALDESERAFRTLAESMPQLVWICNPDGLNVYFNQRWVDYTGLTLEESYGRGWASPFHSDDQPAAWQAWNLAVASGDTYRIESRLRRADGTYHWFLMRGVPSRDATGEIVRWFGTCTDIDELKRAEQEARSARERLALAVKVGRSGTFEWDIRNNVSMWTPELEELYGLAPGTFGGRYEDWEALVLPEDAGALRACVEESLKTGEFSSEWRIRRAGCGEIRWIVAHAKVFFDEDVRPLRMIGFNRDITDRKQAEQEVLRLNQDLERRVAERTSELQRIAAELEKRNREVERVNRMKTEFLARASHELRTPLNAIMGYSDLLSEQPAGPLPPPYPRFVSNIQEGARHLLAMVNDLLDLSRIEAGRIELHLERFDISPALDEVLSVIAPLAEMKRISVENRIARDAAVVADRLRFKQILYNLLSNAVKFTPEEGRVWVETATGGETFTICVGDTGMGIAPGDQEAIFEEFHQVASGKKPAAGGTGLGLAITRKLANIHGGGVRVESELGKGSRFLVWLPVAGEPIAPGRMEVDAQGAGSGR